jgi:ribosomal protein S18 acetylase RimI-like enzyme
MALGNSPGLSFSLRPVTAEDGAFLLRLYGTTREDEMNAAGFPQEHRAAFVNMQFQAQQTHYHKFFPQAEHSLVLLGDKPVGRVWIDRSEREIHLLDIALLPEFCNQGLGAAVMRQLIAESGQKRLPISVYVLQHSPALRFYQRLGFVQTREEDFNLYLERQPGN